MRVVHNHGSNKSNIRFQYIFFQVFEITGTRGSLIMSFFKSWELVIIDQIKKTTQHLTNLYNLWQYQPCVSMISVMTMYQTSLVLDSADT
jgi:hypothetical protein